jgi:hypothetical protein
MAEIHVKTATKTGVTIIGYLHYACVGQKP